MNLRRGDRIDRYIVEDLLGEGGMAVVYRARHATLGTPHAVKMLKVAHNTLKLRMLREGQLQASLRHPHIVAVTDVLEGDAIGLVMELVEGPTLRQLIAAGPIRLADALVIFRGICLGVGVAHGRGFIHRDLKPDNVLLAIEHDRLIAKVADFGLVKALDDGDKLHRTRTGVALGTPAYMSPEQINDASRVDRRADMWSLGCILYALVCGRVPFDAADVLPMFGQIAEGRYTPPRELAPDLPDSVVQAIDGLLQVDPRRRIADCAVLLRMLDGDTAAPPLHDVSIAALPPAEAIPTSVGPFSLSPESATLTVAKQLVRTAPHQPTMTLAPVPGMANDPTRTSSDTHSTWNVEPVARPAEATTEVHKPSRRSPLPAIAVAAGLILAFGGALWATQGPVEAAPSAAPVVAPPTEPEPAVREAHDPAPQVAPPVVETPAPTPAVAAPAPIRKPKPTAASAPVPEPAPAPEPTPMGAVSFEGAEAVWLVGDDGIEHKGAQVPVGSYKIMATFADDARPVAAGYLKVAADSSTHLVCVAQMRGCGPKRR